MGSAGAGSLCAFRVTQTSGQDGRDREAFHPDVLSPRSTSCGVEEGPHPAEPHRERRECLTLNVLLSFAQFEREVTGERIRDTGLQTQRNVDGRLRSTGV